MRDLNDSRDMNGFGVDDSLQISKTQQDKKKRREINSSLGNGIPIPNGKNKHSAQSPQVKNQNVIPKEPFDPRPQIGNAT